MLTGIFVVAILVFAGWLIVNSEGTVILEDLADPESVLALVVMALIIIFAFVIPDIQDQRLPRWHNRLFGLIPTIALLPIIFPSTINHRAGIRSTALVVLVAMFLMAAVL